MSAENESQLIERELRATNRAAFDQAVEEESEEELTAEDELAELEAEQEALTAGILREAEKQEEQAAAAQLAQSLAKEQEEDRKAEEDAAALRVLKSRTLVGEEAEIHYMQVNLNKASNTVTSMVEAAERETEADFQAYAQAEQELLEIEATNEALEQSVTVQLSDGKTVEFPLERYQELLATEEQNKQCRYLGVEQFRIWAQGKHPEVVSVQDALRACSVGEMRQWLNELAPVVWDSHAVGNVGMEIFEELATRLKHREERRAEAQAELDNMEAVMPE